jgi:NAD(P)H-hydrate epimerase
MIEHLRLVTGSQMAWIDAETVRDGTPGHVLMARAGAGAASVIRNALGGFAGRRIVVLCGKGNNGGDGFVVARLARRYGADVSCYLFSAKKKVVGDARAHLEGAERAGVVITSVEAIPGHLTGSLNRADAIVDALLGTGLSGPPRRPIADVIDCLRRSDAPIFAIDIPSGMDADTGGGVVANVADTITFGQPKFGHFLHPGRSACGRLHLVDIGLSPAAILQAQPSIFLNHALCAALPGRDPRWHKGDAGRVTLIAGAAGTTGAAVLAARASLKIGAGLVTVGTPSSVLDIIESQVTEAMTRPLPEVRRARCLSRRAKGEVNRLLEGADVLAIGPGLGMHHETTDVVRRTLSTAGLPAVVDADALNAYAGCPEGLASEYPRVLTPHPGEFARLMGHKVQDPTADAVALAEKSGATVVLKGAPSVIATKDGLVYINPSGNAGMATAGSGDVLTGTIAGLISQGVDADRSVCAGVYLHGLAGDIAASHLGERGLCAGDLIDAIPQADKALTEGRNRYVQRVQPPANFLDTLN